MQVCCDNGRCQAIRWPDNGFESACTRLYSKGVILENQRVRMHHIIQITAKGQTTIPQDIRAALHVAPASPSQVRFKLFTLDHRLVRGALGRLARNDRKSVQHSLDRLLRENP
jgi:hypothetical protein